MTTPDQFGVFATDQLDECAEFFRAHGFAIVRGLHPEQDLRTVESECVAAQQRLAAGELSDHYGTAILVDDQVDRPTLPNYVTYVSDLSPAVDAAIRHPLVADLVGRWLADDHWLLEQQRFGVVYQDARQGPDSGYTRIGWHTDWQSGPHLDIWPAVAFTIHVDGTSPANGFLRVVPGSHRWSTPAPFENANGAQVPEGAPSSGGHTDEPPPFPMPLGFDKVPGEVAVYCERGDTLFHDAYLWHSAARGTDDDSLRRHLRGSFHSGRVRLEDEHLDDFVKNAAR
ncbi:MAG: phytanoyl-CoA dioxygenase family protein [Actinomycetes bacterium]